VFSVSLENQMTGGFDHDGTYLTMPTANTLGIPAQFGIQGIPQIAGNGGLPTIDPSGFSTFGSRRFQPSLTTETGLQFMDNLTKTHGNHELKMGYEFNHIRGDTTGPSYSKGQFIFSGRYSDIPNKSSGLVGIADMLLFPGKSTVPNGIDNLGGVSVYNGSNFASTYDFADYTGIYAQDNWRATPDLTLNLGLRWDYSSPYGESNGRQANLIMGGEGNGPSGTYYIPQKGCSVARSTAFNTLISGYNITVDCVSGLRVNTAQKTNFAPRLGFAYRIAPRLVVRAGFGIAYGAFDTVGYGQTLGTNYPFLYQINSLSATSQIPVELPNGQTATMENTFGVINLQDPAQVSGVGLNISGKQYNYKTPYTESLNLATQYQFTNRDSIQVGYVGTLGRHLDAYGSHNSPSEILPPGVNLTPYLPFPKLGPKAQYLQTIATSSYNSLQTTYQHQFKNNLELLANYTYGKCMSDEAGKADFSALYTAEWLPGFGIRGDNALCIGDATHVVHASGEYALPFGRGTSFLSNTNKLVNALIGGWYFNYIYTFQTGQPFTVGCPVATTSDFGCHAKLIPGVNPYAGPHNQTQWLNPNAFAQPPVATQIGQTDYSPLGSRPRQVRGPRIDNLDSSVFKTFTTGKGTSLEFRAETFNTLNHPQFSNPGQLNFTNRTKFSTITSMRNNPRLGQFALKFFF
jgi:hypothetical protein